MDLKKSFALNVFESRKSTTNMLSGLLLRNKDESFVNNFSAMIDSITVEQVNNAARKFIKPQNFSIVATKPKGFVVPAEEQKSESRAKNMNMALAA
jgi:predicted Zn-dependent peptidase